MIASKHGSEKCLQALLDKEDSKNIINAVDLRGTTALMLASGGGHNKAVKMLLVHGADMRVRNWSGRTSLILASENGHLKVVKSLLENVLHKDNRKNEESKVEKDSEKEEEEDYQPESQDQEDENQEEEEDYDDEEDLYNSLLVAAENGHQEVVKILLSKGGNKKAGYYDDVDDTPLILASREGHLEVVKLLLEDVVHTTKNGEHKDQEIEEESERFVKIKRV